MAGFATRGQPAAIRQLTAMVAAGMPHALLLVGPGAVGKSTLAADVAAALLCTAPVVADRPCRACRGCRLVDDGNHPDVHRLAPDGAAGMIGIDAVRDLVTSLALLPVEGGARVAIVEAAHRMTEDAQNALLKTLEEPPSGVTLILCAEDEERLLPTIHSRCARVRLGTLAAREIEALLEERGEADAPTAGRLARLAAGRPGVAVAYARAPEAAAIRGELARSLLDLVSASRAHRLARIRDLTARARDLGAALAPPAADDDASGATGGAKRKGRGTAGRGRGSAAAPAGVPAAAPAAGAAADPGDSAAETADMPAASGGGTKATPAERRRAAATLLDVWRETARDLALVQVGDPRDLRDPDLLEELRSLAARVPAAEVAAFLERLGRAGQLLDANANPELALDVLALAWPRASVTGSRPEAAA